MQARRWLFVCTLMLLVLAGCASPTGGNAPASTGTPTPTAPTLTPQPPTVTAPALPATGSDHPALLAPENLNAVPPQDVVLEMMYYAGGLDQTGICIPVPEPGALLAARQPELLRLDFCWEGPGASVTATVDRPDGAQDIFALPVRSVGGYTLLEGGYLFDLTRPPGSYHFQITGAGHSVAFRVEVEPVLLPVLYQAFDPQNTGAGSNRRLHLAGFAPAEAIRLLVYRQTDRLAFSGWQELRVGDDGQAWLDVTLDGSLGDDLVLVAWGATSGEVHMTRSGGVELPDFSAVCPGAPPTRLQADSQAVAVADIPVAAELLPGSHQVGTLRAGTQVTLRQGPYCKDGNLWWYFSTPNDGIFGYAAETAGQVFLLEPAR